MLAMAILVQLVLGGDEIQVVCASMSCACIPRIYSSGVLDDLEINGYRSGKHVPWLMVGRPRS